jgi:hypothetical protein
MSGDVSGSVRTRQKTKSFFPHQFSPKKKQKKNHPGYFSQFGAVTRVRVSRNKKTARARSYAFLEFGSPDVAAIAAEAMDG